MSLVRAPNPIWFMVDLEGLPLNDQYYMFTLQNTLPYLPQPIYHDNQGNTPWSDGIQFLPNGTLPDNMYWDPDLVYRLEIRKGPTQADPLIYEINDFVPGDNGVTPIDSTESITDNQISNPQFASISFNSGTTPETLSISASGTYEIAPAWFLILGGSGTATLTQIVLPADSDSVNKPPYAMQFTLSGWESATLYQRFSGNGGLWASVNNPTQQKAIAVSLTALASTVDEPLSIVFAPETPGTPQTIASDTIETGEYQVLQGAAIIDPSTNTNLNNVSYVDIQIILPPSGTIAISNVQVVGRTNPIVVDYQQETIERGNDHLFHVYQDAVVTQPKESLLVGWNFALNPFQFNPTALTTATSQTQYIADQTILHQETASSVQTGKASVPERQLLEIKALTGITANRVALIQYIDPVCIRPYWGNIVSSLVKARIFTTHNTQVKLKMRLIVMQGLPPTIGNAEPISSWPVGSDPIFAAGWTPFIPLNDPSYLLLNEYDLDEGNGSYNGFAFDQFQLPPIDISETNATLGIVLYTVGNLNSSSGTEDSIIFDRISLVPNHFAIDTPPETVDEVLRKCQLYYEKSYSFGSIAGAATSTGARFAEQLADGSSPVNMIGRGFGLQFASSKRTSSPTVTLYSPTGTAANVQAFIANAGAPSAGSNIAITNWTQSFLNSKSVVYLCNTTSILKSIGAPGTFPEAYIIYQYTVDARLGV